MGKVLGRLITLTIAVVMCTAATLYGESAVSREALLKAAFVYNFAKFVEWPAETFAHETAPMTLCILGQDPIALALDTLHGKRIRERQLDIKRVTKDADLPACHILFIGASEHRRLAQIFAILDGSPVLTIGDMDHFSRVGGVINFFKVKSKVRFEINVDQAREARLKISSKLLQLARIIKQDGRGQ